MKAACSSQPSCSHRRRAWSHAGPATGSTSQHPRDLQRQFLVSDAMASEFEVQARLDDPWGEDMLVVENVRPWSFWLGASGE